MYTYMIWLLYILERKINHNFDIKKHSLLSWWIMMLLIKFRDNKIVFSYKVSRSYKTMHNSVYSTECFIYLFRLSFNINITLQNNGQSFAVDKATWHTHQEHSKALQLAVTNCSKFAFNNGKAVSETEEECNINNEFIRTENIRLVLSYFKS